ncbi:GNAT family N-acetyltransferase [Ilyobacter polytropus]|uniref:GCN5-related N-acetyltransferase n=1 Tax=Ilyobacter polytropus (strain ATCC 51220 / DSM 2926 / LMG 16218 / CuHBu1) TaxID=572544 RepID=E3HCG7_ILYPC|nr:GNAT family protein [Ilyobacter polytropus]ADO83943.1 GCN5-related N-acetyltransferase [Ilyobacter polytropus DSM 2926]
MKLNFRIFPVIKTERIVLRNFYKRDIENIYNIRTCDEVMKYMDAPKMGSLEETERFLNFTLKTHREEKALNWVITQKDSEEMIGYIGFWRIDKGHYRGELGYALDKNFWNMGIMSEAVEEVLKFGFENMGLNSIEANVNPLNTKSINLLEKCGFKREGYFRENYYFNGNFIDTATFSIIKKDYKSQQVFQPNKAVTKVKYLNKFVTAPKNLFFNKK